MHWALEHAAFILNKFNVGEDGMTAHERTTGRKWNRPIVEFCETVLAKLALRRREKGKIKQQKRKLAKRCITAVWVGQDPRTGEHVVIKPNGDAVRCRTIKRAPEEHRWSPERILLTRATPRCPAPSSRSPDKIEARLVDEEDRSEPNHPEARSKPEAGKLDGKKAGPELQEGHPGSFDPRDFRITDVILAKYDYTPGCEGCHHKAEGLPGHRGHSRQCRARLIEMMSRDAGDRVTVERAHGRKVRRKKGEMNGDNEPNANKNPVTDGAERAETDDAAMGGGRNPQS